VVEVAIGSADMNTIKSLTSFASSNQTTYLSFTSSFVDDMQGNDIVELSAAPDRSATCFGNCARVSLAARVSSFTVDTTAPELTQISLSVNGTGSLSFSFS
jgi:hypothetical protein